MKAFKNKFVICARDANGVPSIVVHIIDRRNNKLPLIFNTIADTIECIADTMYQVADGLRNEDVDDITVDQAFGMFIANIEMNKDKHVLVTIPGEFEDEIIYDCHYNDLVK